jgi:tetraacyldisaccharide 4'-kinase
VTAAGGGGRVRSAWFDVVSGARTGGGASAVRAVLGALSVPFGAAAAGRRWLYEKGALRQKRASIPVISIGNITVGGTGKTPLVEYLARGLRERGRRPAVIMRGYGAGRAGSCDEAVVLRRNLGPGVPVIEDPNRFRGCETAAGEHAADVAVLDDGFQHIGLHRDLDVVAVDATSPFGFGRLFPAGCLRESPEALARADVVVITRSDIPPADEVEALTSRVEELAAGQSGDALVVTAVFAPSRVTAFKGDAQDEQDTQDHHPVYPVHPRSQPLESLKGARVAAFCGIGNPCAFGTTIRRLGAELVFARRFPDHHPFTAGELADIARAAGSRKVRFVLTTQKDAVRIPEDAWPLAAPPLCVLRAEFAFVDEERAFWGLVEMALEGRPLREGSG